MGTVGNFVLNGSSVRPSRSDEKLREKPALFLAVIEHYARANSGSASGDGPLKIVVRPGGDSLKIMACMSQRSLMSGIYLEAETAEDSCKSLKRRSLYFDDPLKTMACMSQPR